MKLTHASVFSGIGGPEVAAVMLGWENLFHCEINPFGRTVLDYWFPNSKSYEDITKTDFSEWRGRVNVLTGGFPCQPFSYAGQRRGAQDDRYLWPYMFRCIDQIQPDWVVAENVAGILTMVEQGEVSEVASSADLFDSLNDIRGYRLRETFTLQRICDDLEGHGYAVQPVLIPACAVGAPHRRDRVFIIGHRNANLSQDPVCGGQLVGRDGEQGSERDERNAGARGGQRLRGETSRTAPTDTECLRLQHDMERGSERTMSETESRGGENGIPWKVQRTQTDGSGRTATDTDNAGDGASDRQSGRVRQAMDGERQDIALDGTGGLGRQRTATDTDDKLSVQRNGKGQPVYEQGFQPQSFYSQKDGQDSERGELGARWQGFPTVSPVHRGNDGLPFDVDDLTLPFGKWRTEALKAYGNAIVPQVMYEIFRAIEMTYNQ